MSKSTESVRARRPQNGSIPAARRALAEELLRRAIDQYERAVANHDQVEAMATDDDWLEPWTNLALDERSAAETRLLRAIIAWTQWDKLGVSDRLEKFHYRACAVASGDRVYAAVPDPDNDDMPIGQQASDGTYVMRLRVFDRGAVADLDSVAGPETAEGDDLDSAEDVSTVVNTPEGESQARPLAREIAPPPRPLLRTSLTVCPPWDPTGAVTLEVVVLAEGLRDGEQTATLHDLPELQQAGWITHSVNGLEVYVRTIG